MFPQHQQLTRVIAAAAVAAAFAAAPAFATDVRSPDTRETALASTTLSPRTDLRSPDTRAASSAIEYASTRILGGDVRSPDTRDVAIGRSPAGSIGTLEVGTHGTDSFQWADAGIGAATGAGLVLLLVGTWLLVRIARPRPRAA